MQEQRRLFTVDEANRLIPHIEGLIRQIQLDYLGIQNLLASLGENPPEAEVERRLQEHPDIRKLFADIQRCVNAIQETGAQFKGVELGLVDFPSIQSGEVVLLCWQYGEKEVRWWHSTEGGFSDRHPLPGAIDPESLN
jgi:hypothetical protein